MFPQTPHIECVALRPRRDARDSGTRLRGRRRTRPRGRVDRWQAAARSSATRRCGRTTTRRQRPRDPRGVRRGTADGIELGVAVIALDRHSPETIAADIERPGPRPLPALDRGRCRVHQEAADVDARDHCRSCASISRRPDLMLAAMGPKMCALAGAELRRCLLQLDDRRLRRRRPRQVEAGAAEARRETPPVFGYVRTAVGDDAEARLAKEESFYRDLHKGYRNHFDRLGAPGGNRRRRCSRPRERPGGRWPPTRPSTPSSSAASPRPG